MKATTRTIWQRKFTKNPLIFGAVTKPSCRIGIRSYRSLTPASYLRIERYLATLAPADEKHLLVSVYEPEFSLLNRKRLRSIRKVTASSWRRFWRLFAERAVDVSGFVELDMGRDPVAA